MMNQLAPRPGRDLRGREWVERVFVDIVSAGTMLAGYDLCILNGVGEAADVRTFGNAKATSHLFTVNSTVKGIVRSRSGAKSFISGRFKRDPFRVGH
jgi:hypothetical protein